MTRWDGIGLPPRDKNATGVRYVVGMTGRTITTVMLHITA